MNYRQKHPEFPIDDSWFHSKHRENFITEIANLAFGDETIERGFTMEEVTNRIKVYCEFSNNWEQHTGQESC